MCINMLLDECNAAFFYDVGHDVLQYLRGI